MKGFEGESLSKVERVRFNNYLYGAFQSHQVYFMQWRRVRAGDEAWFFFARYFADQMLKAPGVVTWWQRHEEVFIPEFRQYIDASIAAIQADGPLEQQD